MCVSTSISSGLFAFPLTTCRLAKFCHHLASPWPSKTAAASPLLNNIKRGGGYIMYMYIIYLFPGGVRWGRGWGDGASEQSKPSEPNGEPVWNAIHIRHDKICT